MKDDTNRALPDDLADRFACTLVVELNEYLISGDILRFPRPTNAHSFGSTKHKDFSRGKET